MSDRPLTPIFEDLPDWVKIKLNEESLQPKDWRSCMNCKARRGKKLMACAQCKPFLIIPTYYCSPKCQRADWRYHKAQCLDITQKGVLVSQQKSADKHFSLTKRVEHWLRIHSKDIEELVIDLFYFRTNFNPRSTTVLIDLHIEDANSDPPRAWPTKLRLVPEEAISTNPWATENQDFVTYVLMFSGAPLTTTCVFPENWRAEMKIEDETLSNFDLIYLNLFLAAPQTVKVAEMQRHFLKAAVKVGREAATSQFRRFDSKRLKDIDNGSKVLELVQSEEWLAIFKEIQIWHCVDQIGFFESFMEAFDAVYSKGN